MIVCQKYDKRNMKSDKSYINDIDELISISENKEKIFIEYKNGFEEIADAHLFKKEDWLFTIKSLKNVSNGNFFRFFKLNC